MDGQIDTTRRSHANIPKLNDKVPNYPVDSMAIWTSDYQPGHTVINSIMGGVPIPTFNYACGNVMIIQSPPRRFTVSKAVVIAAIFVYIYIAKRRLHNKVWWPILARPPPCLVMAMPLSC